MITLQQLASGWNSFFFAPVPVHTIALFRIVFGCILLGNALFILPHMDAYLGPKGLLRYSSYVKRFYGRALSLFFLLRPTMRSVRFIVWLHIASVTLMTIGVFTPLSTLVVFVTLRSIVNRNPEICNGGDNVAKIMSFLLIFAPSGRGYSLDAILFSSAQTSTAMLHEPSALRLMQIQVAVIYVSTAYWKLKGATYRSGTAVYYVANNQLYKRLPIPAFLLRTPFVQALTWGCVALEFALGSLIWVADIRPCLVIAGIVFHLALEYSMNLHLFGWYMMACLMLFVDPVWILRAA